MTASESILFGIVSGVIAGFLVYALSQVFRKIVLPWYSTVMYRGYDVAGTWRVVEMEPAQRREITFTLAQKAGVVTGISTHVLRGECRDDERTRTYALTGELRDRFLSLMARHVDRRRIGVATIMIEITGDGQQMEGYIAAYSSTASRIVGCWCRARRILD